MRCPKCESEVSKGAKFCAYCGEKLELVVETNSGPRNFEFTSCRVDLSKIYADFTVSFNERGTVSLRIDGDEEMKAAIVASLVNGVVYISGKVPGLVHYGSTASVSRSGGVLTVNNVVLDPERKLKIQLSLPWRVVLDLRQYTFGSMVCLTDGGDVTLRKEGIMPIKFLTLNSLTANVSGVSDIEIDKVMTSFEVRNSGVCNIDATELAGELNMNISGTSRMNVSRVNLTSADLDISRMGNVDLGQGTIDRLSVNISGMGTFNFDGSVSAGSFNASGMSRITVAKCAKVLQKNRSGMSSISLG